LTPIKRRTIHTNQEKAKGGRNEKIFRDPSQGNRRKGQKRRSLLSDRLGGENAHKKEFSVAVKKRRRRGGKTRSRKGKKRRREDKVSRASE